MAKKICERISNTAGRFVRLTFSVVKSGRKAGKLIRRTTTSVSYSAKRLRAKLVKLPKRISAEGHFASFDEKQKSVFSELGKEVFYGLEGKRKDVLSVEIVKDLLKEAHNYESSKQKIRDKLSSQKRKIDEIVIFRRATLDLEHDDPRVRRVAIGVLKRLSNKAAIPYLTKSLEDADPGVRERAREVLHLFLKKRRKSDEMGKKQKENPGKEELSQESIES